MAKLDWDKVGGVASSICAVHCVLTGVALGFLSAIGAEFMASHATEWAFLGLAILAGGFAIRSGIRRHGSWKPSLLFVAGLGAIVVRHLSFPHAHVHDHAGAVTVCQPPLIATVLSVGGGCLLVAFHVVNSWLSHRQCQVPALSA